MSYDQHKRYRMVQFKEGDVYIAQCLEHDISAFASDSETLIKRFVSVFMVEWDLSVERHGTPFAEIEPAPERFHEMWDETEDVNNITVPGYPPVAMALAA